MDYELTIVLPGDTTAAKKKAVVARIEKLVKTLKGEFGKPDEWGKLELAYKIKGNLTGNFVHIPLKLESANAKALADKLRLDEDVIRYLLVRKENGKKSK